MLSASSFHSFFRVASRRSLNYLSFLSVKCLIQNGFATVALNGTESSSLGAPPSQSQSITEDSVCNEIFQ